MRLKKIKSKECARMVHVLLAPTPIPSRPHVCGLVGFAAPVYVQMHGDLADFALPTFTWTVYAR